MGLWMILTIIAGAAVLIATLVGVWKLSDWEEKENRRRRWYGEYQNNQFETM